MYFETEDEKVNCIRKTYTETLEILKLPAYHKKLPRQLSLIAT